MSFIRNIKGLESIFNNLSNNCKLYNNGIEKNLSEYETNGFANCKNRHMIHIPLNWASIIKDFSHAVL